MSEKDKTSRITIAEYDDTDLSYKSWCGIDLTQEEFETAMSVIKPLINYENTNGVVVIYWESMTKHGIEEPLIKGCTAPGVIESINKSLIKCNIS